MRRNLLNLNSQHVEALRRRRLRPILSTQERRWLRILRELQRGFHHGACLLLDSDWLSKNDVTLTECQRLSNFVGDAMRERLDIETEARRRPQENPR